MLFCSQMMLIRRTLGFHIGAGAATTTGCVLICGSGGRGKMRDKKKVRTLLPARSSSAIQDHIATPRTEGFSEYI